MHWAGPRRFSELQAPYPDSLAAPQTMPPRSGTPHLHPAMHFHTQQADRAVPVRRRLPPPFRARPRVRNCGNMSGRPARTGAAGSRGSRSSFQPSIAGCGCCSSGGSRSPGRCPRSSRSRHVDRPVVPLCRTESWCRSMLPPGPQAGTAQCARSAEAPRPSLASA